MRTIHQYYDPKGYFYFGNCSSKEYRIILTEPPPMVFAERETETISIPGMSGDLHIDNGRYKNVTITYHCAIVPWQSRFEIFTVRDYATDFINALHKNAGYNALGNSFEFGRYRMARVKSAVTVESIVEQAGIFSIDFDCKPQRYFSNDDFTKIYTAAGTLRSPTAFPAKPLITIYGTSPGTVTVGSVTVEIKSITDQITLDCETMNAYRNVGGVITNANSNIYAPEFPELVPGENAIRWTGGITKVEIIPRWWTL